jgi:hypothetical protein
MVHTRSMDEILEQQLEAALQVEPIWILPKEMDPVHICLTISKIADLLQVSGSTLRGWISRKQFPPCDGRVDDRTSYWRLPTVIEYVRNAPGGRLGYPVG